MAMRSLKGLVGYEVRAQDSNIGTLKDFYFDDFYWVIRYLVSNFGDQEPGRVVLISPASVLQPNDAEKVIPTQLSIDQVEKSPLIEQDMPVSRQYEITLHQHYQWPFYWVGGSVTTYPLAELAEEMREAQTPRTEEIQEARLESFDQVKGFGIRARDGEIGHLWDFVIDDSSWKVLYMVVDTGNWLPGRKVLVSLNWVEKFDWEDQAIQVDLSKETIQNSPLYDETMPINREYEESLYTYYGRKKYWE